MSKRPDPFEALADLTRRRTLELLRDRGDLTAGDIAAAFPHISRPAVSRHLRVLRTARLVTARQAGREWIYRLEPAALEALYRGWLESFAPIWEASLQRLKARVESGTTGERQTRRQRKQPSRKPRPRE